MPTRRASSRFWLANYGKPCVNEDIVKFEWYPGLTKNQIRIHDGTQPLWAALGAVFLAYNYKVPTSYTGAYACRQVTGGTSWSGHAWPLAMDVNAKTNPYISHKPIVRNIKWGVETDMPAAMVREAELITAGGNQAFWWGGRYRTIKDAMHWEINVTLEDIAKGVYAPRGYYGMEDELAKLSEEAQEFWEDTFRDMQALDPETNQSFARVLVDDYRARKEAGQTGKHTHSFTGETEEN